MKFVHIMYLGMLTRRARGMQLHLATVLNCNLDHVLVVALKGAEFHSLSDNISNHMSFAMQESSGERS